MKLIPSPHTHRTHRRATAAPLALPLPLPLPTTRRYFATVCVSMLVISISYYGITLALGDLAGSLHVNFTLTALAELPAYVVGALIIDRVGRRLVVFGGVALTGVALCGAVLVPRDSTARLVLAMLGKFGGSATWSFAFIYVGEAFPTVVRTLVIGIGNQAADVGGVLTPLLLYVGRVTGYPNLAWLVMGTSALATAALVLLCLPETAGKPQPDTFDDLMRNVAGHTTMEGPREVAAAAKYLLTCGCMRTAALRQRRRQLWDAGPTGGGAAAGSVEVGLRRAGYSRALQGDDIPPQPHLQGGHDEDDRDAAAGDAAAITTRLLAPPQPRSTAAAANGGIGNADAATASLWSNPAQHRH